MQWNCSTDIGVITEQLTLDLEQNKSMLLSWEELILELMKQLKDFHSQNSLEFGPGENLKKLTS